MQNLGVDGSSVRLTASGQAVNAMFPDFLVVCPIRDKAFAGDSAALAVACCFEPISGRGELRQDRRQEYLFRRHDDQSEHEVEEYLLVSAHADELAAVRLVQMAEHALDPGTDEVAPRRRVDDADRPAALVVDVLFAATRVAIDDRNMLHVNWRLADFRRIVSGVGKVVEVVEVLRHLLHHRNHRL